MSMDSSYHYNGFGGHPGMYSLFPGGSGADHLQGAHPSMPYSSSYMMHPYGMFHPPSSHTAAAQQALEVQARIIHQQQQHIAHMNALASMATPSGSPLQKSPLQAVPSTPVPKPPPKKVPSQIIAPPPTPTPPPPKKTPTRMPKKRKSIADEAEPETETKVPMIEDSLLPKAHTVPASIPVVKVIEGVEWITFYYTIRGNRQGFLIRTDIDSVAFEDLTEEFKVQNCVYPKANCNKSDYKGNRWDYESSVNFLGWKLAYRNEKEIGGRRGLIQRAVDSFRNRFPELRSRRVLRQEKYVNGTLRRRNDKIDDPANEIDEVELLNEAKRTNENSDWSEILSLLARRQKSPKSITFEGTAEGRLYKTRIRVDVDLVDPSAADDEFKEDNCVYPRSMGTFEAYLQSLHYAGLPPFNDSDDPRSPFPSSLKPSESDFTSLRYNQEVFCNEVAWRLAHLNSKLIELVGTFIASVAIHPRRSRRILETVVKSLHENLQRVALRSIKNHKFLAKTSHDNLLQINTSNAMSAEQKKLFDILKVLKEQHGKKMSLGAMQKQLTFRLAETSVWRHCDKIDYDLDTKLIWYKHDYSIQSKEELLELLQSNINTQGTDIRELKESCPDIYAMVDELEKSGDIFLTRNKDDTPRVAYINCMNEKVGDGPAEYPSSEFAKYWHEVELPADEEALLKELTKAGLRTLDGSSLLLKTKKVVAKAKTKRGRRIKITNTHLEGVDLTKDWSASKK
ncbi:hypothetical protein BC829DRAFT_441182 [Chytridium lagenaria]|nr:hypothetical protein BC829DRAFT_441182 [Chytridium lagenaria]